MPKNIVFCADGTWNHPSDPDDDETGGAASNVYKTFLKLEGELDGASIRLANEQEKTLRAADDSVEQVAKYIHGVGDSKNFLARVLGGTVGTGLIARVVRGYTFVSRNYVKGDRIYLVGFSRGAYTARALSGLISAKGLLPPEVADPTDKEGAYRAGSAVWYEWRREVMTRKSLSLRDLAAFVRDLPGFLSERRGFDLVAAPIEAVAVWDTVGALGIPQFDAHGAVVDAFRFADTTLSPNVKFGRHAVSTDEQRISFTPTLWTAGSPEDQTSRRIVQVLFPGGHSDVGGGYAEAGLSDCALQWMTRELSELGVKIGVGRPPQSEKPDPYGLGHEEWTKPRWAVLGTATRVIPDAPGLCLSQAVLLRLAAEAGKLPRDYLPANIPTYLKGKLAADLVEVISLDDPDLQQPSH